MFWHSKNNSNGWREIISDEIPEAITPLLDKIKSEFPEIQPFLDSHLAGNTDSKEDFYLSSITYKPLEYYLFNNQSEGKAVYFFRFEFKYLDRSDSQNESTSYSKLIATYQEGTELEQITTLHFNGTSPPMHELSSLAGPIDLNLASSHLDCFTSCLSADWGCFTIVRNKHDVNWPEEHMDTDYFWSYARNKINQRFDKPDIDNPIKIKDIKETFLDASIDNFDDHCNLDHHQFRDMHWEYFLTYNDDKYTQDELNDFLKIVVGALNLDGDFSFPVLMPAFDSESTEEKDAESSIMAIEDTVEQDPVKERYHCYLRFVLYGGVPFLCIFKVTDDGSIEMVADLTRYEIQNLPGQTSTSLPIGIYHFSEIKEHSDFGLLLWIDPFKTDVIDRQLFRAAMPNPSLTIDEYNQNNMSWLGRDRHIEVKNGYHQLTSENLIKKWVGRTFYGPIHFSNVYFFQNFDFSEVLVENSVHFKNCHFLGQVSFRNSRIGENLTFDNCTFICIPSNIGTFDKIQSKGDEESHCLNDDLTIGFDMNQVKIQGDLRITNSTFYGAISIRRATIDGNTYIQGNDVLPLYDFEYDLPTNFKEESRRSDRIPVDSRFKGFPSGIGIDLRGSKFGKGLQLGAQFSKIETDSFISRTKKTASKPLHIAGILSASSIEVGGNMILTGLIITSLNEEIFDVGRSFCQFSLDNATIRGNIQCWQPNEHTNEVYKYLRSFTLSNFNITNSNVYGNVDLRGHWIGGNLEISNSKIEGGIYLKSLWQMELESFANNMPKLFVQQIDGFNIFEFASDLLVEDKEDLNFGNSKDNSESDARKIRFAHFSRAHILGNLFINNCHVRSKIDLGGCHVGDQIRIINGSSGPIYLGWSVTPLVIANSKTNDYLCEASHCSFIDYIDGQPQSIKFKEKVASESSYDFTGILQTTTSAQNVIIHNIHIKGSLHLEGLLILPSRKCTAIKQNSIKSQEEIAGAIDALNNSIIDGSIKDSTVAQPEAVQAPLDPGFILTNSIIDGDVSFNEEDLFKNIWRMYASSKNLISWYNEVFFGSNGDQKELLSQKEFKNTILKEWGRLGPAILFGDMQLANLSIGGKFDLTDCLHLGIFKASDLIISSKFTTQNSETDFVIPPRPFYTEKIEIAMLKGGGDLELNGAIIVNDVIIKNSSVNGDLTFDNARLIGHNSLLVEGSDISGAISLTGLYVSKKLELINLNVRSDIKVNSFEDIQRTRLQHNPLVAEKLIINMLNSQGNIYLSTLEVPELLLINSQVNGEAHFYTKEPDTIKKAYAQISRLLDLTGSNFAKLRLWCADQADGDLNKPMWIMERVTLDHLDIHFDPNQTAQLNNQSIDFRGIQFKRLTINEIDNNEQYIGQLLKSMPEDKWTLEPYAQIESHFRAQGRKQEGDKIFSRMQVRWRRDVFRKNRPTKSLRKWIDWLVYYFVHFFFFDKLSKFGTNWRNAGMPVIIILLISVWMSSNNLNWKVLDDDISIRPANVPNTTKIIQAFDIALPIVSFSHSQEEYNRRYLIRNTPNTYFSAFNSDVSIKMSPRNFGMVLSILNFIFLPVFIIAISGLYKRKA